MSEPTNEPRRQPERHRARALYAYARQNPTELDMNVGDEVVVHEMSEQGWAWGQHVGSGEWGWFPSNYIGRIISSNL
ncbi:SH3-domain-containing protein [Zopfia rhizophila CBS 207.26]|uniref:SH3-domain-containing protein n=1 Tax=Zopfia rhizophila CBS 207.26 TaxID=1314779 RepID=A0A6A6EJK3_9PEZI|nr:SH3-domain-containing protein [Zopfia rhizophila CBS 207.26]